MAAYSEYKESGQQWLGMIPSHWTVDSLKHLFTVRSTKGHPELPQLCSTQRYGVIPQSLYENRVVSVLTGLDTLKVVCVGDFVISLRSFQGGIEYAYYGGIISPAYTILEPKTPSNSPYYRYLLKSQSFIQLLQSTVTGIREGQNIDYGRLRYESIPIPPVEEQKAIVAYLDKVTVDIDKAIEAKERIIAALEERRKIIITQAVTRGINPDVPLRDSGIDWLGKIPAHWEVIRIKYLLKEEKARSMKGLEEPLSMSQRKGLIPTKDMSTIPNLAASYVDAKLVSKGNLVFNKLKAHLGVFNVSGYDGLVSPDYAVYSSTGRANLKFLEYIFKTPNCINEFKKLITGVGAGLSRLYTGDLFSIYCAIPPLKEQNEISDYIVSQTHSISEAIDQCQKSIDLLNERKNIIINETVTGHRVPESVVRACSGTAERSHDCTK